MLSDLSWGHTGAHFRLEGGERSESGAGDCIGRGPPGDSVFKTQSSQRCKYAVIVVRKA